MTKSNKSKTVEEANTLELLWTATRRHITFLLGLTNVLTITIWLVKG